MQIRTRLTLQFLGIFALLLLVFLAVIYLFTSIHRQNEFYDRTHDRAKATALFFLEKDEISPEVFRQYQRMFYRSLPEEIVQVYNSNNELKLQEGEADNLQLDNQFLENVRQQGYMQKEVNERQIVGIFYPDNQGDFVVVASSIDVYNLEKMRYMRLIMIVGYFFSIIVVFFVGWNFAKGALRPFRKIIKEVERINASDLHRRRTQTEGKDEVADLTRTFNNMLDRLETAFEMQNTFISNASHELRTPLTAMIGEIEVSLLKKRTADEYEKVLESIHDDATRLANLSNGLLQIAHASFDISKIKLHLFRFDEVVWQAYEEAQRRRPNAHFEIDFKNLPEDENSLVIKGNEPLLLIAMLNILENAVKFSPERPHIKIKVKAGKGFVEFSVMDQGLGINKKDLNKVFVPFWRADNVRNISGHGIGLPLSERIMNLHNGSIKVNSIENEGTEVTLRLPQAYYFIP